MTPPTVNIGSLIKQLYREADSEGSLAVLVDEFDEQATLNDPLLTREQIGRAKALLMARHGIDPEGDSERWWAVVGR